MIVSNSSKKSTQRRVLTNSKALSSRAAVSPRKLETMPSYRMVWKGSMNSVAMASATLVLPFPGGPASKIRCRGLIP